jgi:hypothetical protein
VLCHASYWFVNFIKINENTIINIFCILQACTGIDDVGIAIAHLEEANWALVVSLIIKDKYDLLAYCIAALKYLVQNIM